ncbi:2-phospho-L-lactate guanylyltransferase [Angustibacter sp. Root456]|uniref:2-phospho-L-lactate guanylyltransferase n=1 Tax=Angustibacter sp. Root456 TaxID=1736539 RepID=UPI0006FC9DAC|nr:2-phospho-L-lactate guanylyltransferase [Angustibacter sp. Root456]KQX69793.1 hypothetical protein ASD06_01860 [Angustibacter sp. Root456]
MTPRASHRVTAVVPVKPLALAKSRLALAPAQRQSLALAFAVDTVCALTGSPLVAGVLVVTADPIVSDRLRELGVRVAEDDASGLGAAVHHGLQVARRWTPDAGVAVVPADLACLRPDDVTQVLTAAQATRGAFVPDRAATGTTLLVQPTGHLAAAHYGPGSAARHRLMGLVALDDAPARARHDVDTVDDLRAAQALGVGPQTAAALLAVDGPVGEVAF